MKKAIKKLMAALLAVAMLCAMAVPAFAENDNSATPETGTVTVANFVSGKTYKIYRILDIDTHDSSYSSVVYKVNAKWKEFIKSTGTTYFTSVDDKTDVVVVREGLTSDNIAALASAAKTWLSNHDDITADGEQTATANDTSIQFTGKALGYYLLSSSNWGTNNADAIFSLSSSNPDVTINEKNGKPTIDKEIIENNNSTKFNDVNVGDYVQFQTTVTVVDGAPYGYKITDTMSNGLTFVNNATYPLTVTVNNITFDASNYTLTPTTNGFTLTFHDNGDTSVLSTNDVVVVTYYAQVNNNAVVGPDGNTNTASLEYGHTSTNGGSSTTTTYVWDFNIHKYTTTTSNNDIALSGAVFKLYKMNGSTKSYATFGTATTNSADVSVYKLTGWTNTEASATELVTPASGNIKLEGLDAGTYYLEEVTAPDGYNKLTADIEVTITSTMPSASESAVASHTVSHKAVGAEGNASTADEGTVRVLNNAGATLPSTGGIGTTIFYVVGGCLMVAAVVLLVTKKRMENK